MEYIDKIQQLKILPHIKMEDINKIQHVYTQKLIGISEILGLSPLQKKCSSEMSPCNPILVE
jgi:hypothetical protein